MNHLSVRGPWETTALYCFALSTFTQSSTVCFKSKDIPKRPMTSIVYIRVGYGPTLKMQPPEQLLNPLTTMHAQYQHGAKMNDLVSNREVLHHPMLLMLNATAG